MDGEELQFFTIMGQFEDWNAAVRIRKFFVEERNRELEATLVIIIIIIIISWNVSQDTGQISERALIQRQHFVVGVASDC